MLEKSQGRQRKDGFRYTLEIDAIRTLMKVVLRREGEGASSLSKWVKLRYILKRREVKDLGEDQEFSFKHSKYEMPTKDSSGDVYI